jgi:predicted GNAT family N-acyltransferase
MNIIKVVSRDFVFPSWEQWHEWLPENPPPIRFDTSEVFVEISCLLGYDTSRTFGYFHDNELIGCGTILEKVTSNLKIGGVCDIAVNPAYRRNHVGDQIMKVCIAYMNSAGFDVSVLWASIVEMYRKHGYVEIYENMMYRPITGLPIGWDIPRLVALPSVVGTW